MNCSNCKKEIYATAKFCGYCGSFIGSPLPKAKENGKYGYIDIEGNVVIDFKYDGAYHFYENLALVYKINNNNYSYGFINTEGIEVIPLVYEYAENMSEGRALVRIDRKFGYINSKGDLIIDTLFDEADSFKNGEAKVKINESEFQIDKAGNEIS